MHYAHLAKASANFRNHALVHYGPSVGESKSACLLLLAGHLRVVCWSACKVGYSALGDHRFRGSLHAKEQPEHVMVNRLPSKTKAMPMRLLFLQIGRASC